MDLGWILSLLLALLVLAGVILIIVFLPKNEGLSVGDPMAVNAVDLARYQGTWYEIARFPNPFEMMCTSDAKGVYELNGSTLRVINSCQGANQLFSVQGVASPSMDTKVTPPAIVSPAKLDVRFNTPEAMVGQPYWILDIDDNYSRSLVGTPDKKYLWILSRDKTLDPLTYDVLVAKAGLMGYDVSRLQKTPQN